MSFGVIGKGSSCFRSTMAAASALLALVDGPGPASNDSGARPGDVGAVPGDGGASPDDGGAKPGDTG
jgi:hypothetical protein